MNGSGPWEEGTLAARCTVPRTRATAAFLEWMAAYKYTPLDLLGPSILDSVSQVYLPYFRFVVSYSANYSVSIGYHRMEQYTEYETVYEDGKSRQVTRTKSRLRTDWHPYKNEVKDSFAVAVPDQTLHGGDFDAFLHGTVFAVKELLPPSSIDDNGRVMPFTRSPQESFSRLVEGAIGERASSKIKKSLPGDTHRDLRYEWVSSYEYLRVYLPFWYFTWEYRGTTYGALVDGRQDSRVDGRLPKDDELQRSARGTLRPLWIALSIGLVVCLLAAFVGVLSGIAPWIYAATAVAVSASGFVSLRRRHQILSDASNRRQEAIARVLSPELEDPRNLEERDEQEEDQPHATG